MKKKILLAALVMASCFGYSGNHANAQVSMSFNLGVQPLWGPTGYETAEYYYIPDIDAYYDVSSQVYVYLDNGRWVRTAYLPSRYSNVDLYNVHKVVINQSNPWRYHNRHINMYSTYRGRHDQVAIRDADDRRYWANPHHPRHNEWNGAERRNEWGGYRYDRHNRYDRRYNRYDRRDRYDRHDRDDRNDNDDRHDNGRGHGWGHDKH